MAKFTPPPPVPDDDAAPLAAAPAAPTSAPAAPAGKFTPPPPIPDDLTADKLAEDPEVDPLVIARERKRVLESELTASLNGVDDPAALDAAYKSFDQRLGADPVYNLFNQAHKKRVDSLAKDPNYKPDLHYAEAGEDFPARGATVNVGGRDIDASLFNAAQRDLAAEVYATRAKQFGDPHAHQGKTDWERVGHGLKEQAKEAFGLAGATRGMGYIADDAAYMGRGALAGATGDTSEIAKADLASREVQSGLLGGAMNIINLGYGLRDWWQGDDVKGFTDAQLRERLEDEVKRKITIPKQLTPENLEPVFGGQPYKAVLAEAGGAKEAPKADLEWLRFGAPTDETGKPVTDTRSDAEKRAGDIATRLEFSAYGKLMGLPGYRHVAKALAGGAAKVGGAAAESAGKWVGQLIDSKLGHGATVAGAAGAAVGGHGLAAIGTFVANRVARAASWLAEKTGAGVRQMGDEILAGKPLTAGSRVGRTVMEGGKAALEGGVGATPFVLAADTPEDGISTALGLALQSGLHRGAHEALRGEARNEGAGQELARLGAQLKTDTGFDDIHAATTAGLQPGERDTVNAIRGLMSRYKDQNGNPLQMHAVDGKTFEGVLKETFPGASAADLADAARARGFITSGNQVFVNGSAAGSKAEPAKHEGGHLAQRALAALDAQTRESAKAAVSETLYDEHGQPLPEFTDFIDGYNKKAPKAGQINLLKPEDWVRAEDEFIAEHFRARMSQRPGLQSVGALATGDSLFNRMGERYNQWAKENGIRPPDKLSEFNWTEVPEFTKRFGEVLSDAFKDAHRRPEPDPTAATKARKNAARLAEIDKMPPGALTPEVVNEYDALLKENAEIGRRLAQIGGKATPAAPGVASSPASPKAATTPTAAASTPAEAAMRLDVELALNKMGIKGKEAKDLAAQAQGADVNTRFADALSRRTSGKTPPARPPVTPTSPAPVAPPVATPAAPTAPPPATSPVPVAVAPRVSLAAPIAGPGGRQILAGTIAPEHPTPQRAPALANLPKAPEGLGKPGALAPSHETKTPEPTGKLDRTADDDAAEALIAEAPDKTQAALDLVTQASGGDPALIQRRVDPLTGKVSYSGRLDFSKPEHRTLVRSLGLTEPDIAKLQTAQGAGGDVRYVDYWSASKEDAADITGKQRKRELAADKDKKSRELMQKNKAIIFTGVTVWPSGKAVQKGISVDKFIANAGKLLEAAKAAKLPVGYKDVNDPQLVADLQGYIANHKANVKGDGSGPVAGKEMAPGYDPYLIPRNRFDLLNAAFNIDISAAKSGHAAKVAADEARRAAGEKVRKRPALRPETELKAEDAQRVALENGWQVDDATGDTNPFRAMMNKEGRLAHTNEAGETRKGTGEVLESVFENLSPDMIDAVRDKPAGERSIVREVGYMGEPGEPFKKGLPDWGNVAAGFMPSEGADHNTELRDKERKLRAATALPLGAQRPSGGFDGAFHLNTIAARIINDYATDTYSKRMIENATKRGDDEAVKRYAEEAKKRAVGFKVTSDILADLVASLPEQEGKDLVNQGNADPFKGLKEAFPGGKKRDYDSILNDLANVTEWTFGNTRGGIGQNVLNVADLLKSSVKGGEGKLKPETEDRLMSLYNGKTAAQQAKDEASFWAEMSPEFYDKHEAKGATVYKKIEPPEANPGTFMPGKPLKREDLHSAAKAAGVDYDGATEFGDLAFHNFSDRVSVSGKVISYTIEGDVTPEKIAAGRARKLKEFGVESKEGGAFMPPNPSIKDAVEPDKELKSEPGYVYHATNLERAYDIAESGKLDVFKPGYGTDQNYWPDGATKKRSYFTAKAGSAWQFAPEDGKSVILRTKRSEVHKDESTGDVYAEKSIPADKLEILTDKGWVSLTEQETSQTDKRAAIDAAMDAHGRGEITRAELAEIIRANSGHFMPSGEDLTFDTIDAVKKSVGKKLGAVKKEDDFNGLNAWLTPEGEWINVKEHFDPFHPDDVDAWGEYDGDPGIYEAAEAAGFIRVTVEGGKLHAGEYKTPSGKQAKELKDTALMRGLEYTPAKTKPAFMPGGAKPTPSHATKVQKGGALSGYAEPDDRKRKKPVFAP